MLCAVGSLAGERRLRRLPQIFRNDVFFHKKISTQNQGHLFSYALLSGNNKENQREEYFGYASRYFSDYAPVHEACLLHLIQ